MGMILLILGNNFALSNKSKREMSSSTSSSLSYTTLMNEDHNTVAQEKLDSLPGMTTAIHQGQSLNYSNYVYTIDEKMMRLADSALIINLITEINKISFKEDKEEYIKNVEARKIPLLILLSISILWLVISIIGRWNKGASIALLLLVVSLYFILLDFNYLFL